MPPAGAVVGRMRGAVRQHHADRLGDGAHGVGGEHGAAGAAARQHVALERVALLGGDAAGLARGAALGPVHDGEVGALLGPRHRNRPCPASWCPDRAPGRRRWCGRAASARRRRSCRSPRSRSSHRRDGRSGRSRSSRRRRRATPGCSPPSACPASARRTPPVRRPPAPARRARRSRSTSRSVMARTRLLQRWALVQALAMVTMALVFGGAVGIEARRRGPRRAISSSRCCCLVSCSGG